MVSIICEAHSHYVYTYTCRYCDPWLDSFSTGLIMCLILEHLELYTLDLLIVILLQL